MPAGEAELGHRNPAAIADQCIGRKGGFRAEKGPVGLGDQHGERPAQIGGHGDAVLALVDRRHPAQRRLAIGGQRHVGAQIVDRAAAGQSEIDRRAVLDIEQIGDDAVFRLHQAEAQIDLAGGVLVVRREFQRTARPIQPLDIEMGIEIAPFERQRPGKRDFRGQPEDALPESDGGDTQLFEDDCDGKFGDREAARLGRGQVHRALHRHGVADIFDGIGLERLDLEPPEEQRRLAPVERGVVDAQPDPFGIGNGNLAHRDVRAQYAVDIGEPDLPLRGREAVLDEAGQPVLLLLIVHRQHVLRDDDGGYAHPQKQHCGKGEPPLPVAQPRHQNACPMPT